MGSAASSGQTGSPWGPLGCTDKPQQSPAVIDGHGHRRAKALRALPLHGADVTNGPKSMCSLSCASLLALDSYQLGRERRRIR